MKPRDPRPLARWTDDRPVHLDADDYDGRAPFWFDAICIVACLAIAGGWYLAVEALPK
jgi:hypothetical protein